jgi:predicted nucleotidyltransferase
MISKSSSILSKLEANADPTLALDPTFFDASNNLLPGPRKVMLDVLAEVFEKLKAKGQSFEPTGMILTGSLVSVNYDAASDVDLHVLVDFSKFDDPELMSAFLSEFARNFNGKINLRNRNLELYFQDDSEPHVTPGIYDVKNDTWLMPPTGEKIEKTRAMKDAAANHLARVEEFENEVKALGADTEQAKLLLCRMTKYFEGIRTMRKNGIASDGLASVGNQTFKLLRRNGAIPLLSKLIEKARDKVFEA